jgi:CheY-like chemotaxis protein
MPSGKQRDNSRGLTGWCRAGPVQRPGLLSQVTLNRPYVRDRTDKTSWAVHGAIMAIQHASLQHVLPSIRRLRQHDRPIPHTTLAHLHGRSSAARHTPPSFPRAGASGEPVRILIVDDSHSTAPLEYLLHGLGYWTTRVAFCGKTALTLAQDFNPSVVLLALDLPDMSAYHVAQRLRERSEVRELRLIALTEDYVHTGRDLAREAGFERYLGKPVSVSALQELLQADPT